MPKDIREYFRKCTVTGSKRTVYTGTQLARSGISDMDALCALLEQEIGRASCREQEPEMLLGMLGIGPKSMEVIHEVCACYQSERGDTL